MRPASADMPQRVVELRCHAVSLAFGGVAALREVDLELCRGEITVVIGPNGAGKTSLLNAISGGVTLAGGQVELVGMPVSRNPTALARAGVSRSFQDPQLVDSMTVVDNVQLGLHARDRYALALQAVRPGWVRRRERESSRAALEALELVGLEHRAADRAAALTYGSRKLVDIARALVGHPRVVLLDEPSSGLDDSERAELGAMLKSVRDAGRSALLVVEHNMDLVRDISDVVVGMAAGVVVASGSAEAVLSSNEFRAALTGGSASSEGSETS